MKIYKKFKNYLRALNPSYYSEMNKYKVPIKYIISGGTAAFVDLVLLYALIDIFKIYYLLSASIAFLVAFFISFYLQKFWTFRDNNKEKIYKQMYLYLSVGIINLCINAAGMYILVEHVLPKIVIAGKFNATYVVPQIIMGVFIAISSFLIYKFVIFKKKKRELKKSKNGKLKILIATGIFPPDIGGPATYARVLCDELPKFGCEVRVATYFSEQIPNSKFQIYRINRNQNIIFRYFKYFWQVFKLAGWADAVYAHDLVSVGLPCATVKLIKPKIRLSVRLGGDFLWEKAYNNGWTNKPLREYYKQPKNFKEKIFLLIYKFVLAKCDKVIFSTDWQKKIYEKYLNVNPDKAIVIFNAFPESINSSKFFNKDENKSILFAGRLIKLKNLDKIIKVVADIQNISFIIIGKGPEKNNLAEKIKGLNIKDRIVFKETMPQKELDREISSSYLVIIPSITEISPNLALECIGLRKPVLVTKECGFYSEYQDRLVFINPFSIDDIKNKINYLLDKNNYKNYLDRIKLINIKRSWQDLAKEHFNLFKELIN